jgi:flavin-dependent dehydrogenase
VCIVGAGPAGLSAGARLEQKGIKAMIFDSREEVGGKCQAFYDEALVFHDMTVLTRLTTLIEESSIRSAQPFFLTLLTRKP